MVRNDRVRSMWYVRLSGEDVVMVNKGGGGLDRA